MAVLIKGIKTNNFKMAYAILKDKENNFYYQVVVDGNQTHFITPEFVNRFSSKEKAFDEMLFFIANKSFEALKNNGDKDIYSINIIEEKFISSQESNHAGKRLRRLASKNKHFIH